MAMQGGIGQINAAEFDYGCSSRRGEWKIKTPLLLPMTEKVQLIFLFLLGHWFAHKFNLRDV